jgi:hypothetical protein
MPNALSGEMLTNPVMLTDKGSITASTAESRRSAPNPRASDAPLRGMLPQVAARGRAREAHVDPPMILGFIAEW